MSVDQGVFALAGTGCVIGSVVAVASRDPRVAGAALLVALLSIGALYATLAAPLVAGLVVLVTILIALPLVVHLTVPAARAQLSAERVPTAAAALVIAAVLLILLVVAVAAGELPVNVSLRSTDGYDIVGLRDLAT